jgi:orotidine-5'-phosphate decarboxylase
MKKFFGERRSGIIFAADLPTYDDNARVLEQIADVVDVIKVNVPLLYVETPKVVQRLARTFGLPVFADLKIADVPHTNNKIVEIAAENEASAVMVHGIVGPDALMGCVETADGRCGIIVQLELTNPGGKLFTARIADEMAQLASGLGVYGMQAPANRPERIAAIRNIVGPEAVVVCCGVGAQGGSLGEVLRCGGSYGIIGRSIYAAPDPRAAVTEIVAAAKADEPSNAMNPVG